MSAVSYGAKPVIKPYYSDKWVTIFHGDCREILPQLDVKVDLVLTDPPYGTKSKRTGILTENRLQYKDNGVTKETFEILASASRAIVILSDWHNTHNYAIAIEDCGQAKWGEIIWEYTWISGYKSKTKFKIPYIHNTIQLFGNIEWQNQRLSSIWKGSGLWSPKTLRGTKTFGHPDEKPVGLFTELLKCLFSSKTILDPFTGSGSILVAAKKLNRYSIGIEIEEKYCEIAAKRCSQSVMELNI